MPSHGSGDPEVLNALEIARSGPLEVSGLVVEALPSMEILRHKESPAENAIYRFELDSETLPTTPRVYVR